MSYRKLYVDGVRMFVVRQPTRAQPIGVFACRASLLPIGISCQLDRGWALFDVEVGFRQTSGPDQHSGPPGSNVRPYAGGELEDDDAL